MRGNLLWADSLEQRLHVVVVREGDGVLSSVVWVLVTLLHVLELVLIVRLAIESLILWLFPNVEKQDFIVIRYE